MLAWVTLRGRAQRKKLKQANLLRRRALGKSFLEGRRALTASICGYAYNGWQLSTKTLEPWPFRCQMKMGIALMDQALAQFHRMPPFWQLLHVNQTQLDTHLLPLVEVCPSILAAAGLTPLLPHRPSRPIAPSDLRLFSAASGERWLSPPPTLCRSSVVCARCSGEQFNGMSIGPAFLPWHHACNETDNKILQYSVCRDNIAPSGRGETEAMSSRDGLMPCERATVSGQTNGCPGKYCTRRLLFPGCNGPSSQAPAALAVYIEQAKAEGHREPGTV